MAVRSIKKYLNTIQRSLLPSLTNELGINFNPSPVSMNDVTVTYSGELNGKRIVLSFNSSNSDLADYRNEPVVMCDTYYGVGGNSAGILNLDYIDECVESVYSALYELGFRSERDIADEKARAEEEKRKNLEKSKVKTPTEPEEDEVQQDELEEPEEEIDVEEAISEFDNYYNTMKSNNMVNGLIEVTLSFSIEDNKYRMVNVDIYYITSNMCLVQTDGLNPKIDRTATWDSAKDYIRKVADKLNAAISVSAYDENNKEIELVDYDTNDDVSVDVSI